MTVPTQPSNEAPTTEPHSVAVVEIGSGSVKLLVARRGQSPSGLVTIVDRSIKTDLLKGLGAAGPTEEALAATDLALAEFAADIKATQVELISVIATSVGRRLAEGSSADGLSSLGSPNLVPLPNPLVSLNDVCERHVGRAVEVLSGTEEARLGWVGAVGDRDLEHPAVVLDIGSGSTELAFGQGFNADPIGTFSLPIGARTVTADYLRQDPPGPDELSAALSVIELHFDDVKREAPQILPLIEDAVVLGVGAISQIARVEIGLDDPSASVGGHELRRTEVGEVFRALATETIEDRAFNPGLAAGDVVDIVGGMCILVEFLRRFGVDGITISETDLRHGRARELLFQQPGVER